MNERAYAFALEHPRVRWVLLGFTPWDFNRMSYPGLGPRAEERALFDAAARRLADDVVLGWVSADFSFAEEGRASLPVALSVVVRRQGDNWRIGHYHVSHRI